MKIAYCLDSVSAMGGIERVTLSKANALADVEGNVVYLIVTRGWGNPVFPLHPKIQVINMNLKDRPCTSMIRMFWNVYLKSIEHKKKIAGVLNEIRPDIVVSTGMSEKFLIRSLSLSYKPLIIKEIHFNTDCRLVEAQGLLKTIYASIGHLKDYYYKMKSIDQIVILTEEDKLRNWKGKDKVTIIPNPLTNNTTLPPSLLNEKRVIAAGRLVRQKNFESLIRSWKQVHALHPDWNLDIYGEGPLKSSLEKQINELNLRGIVRLQGKTNEMFKEMSESSIFVLSSIYEGFGLVLIEAMSCGLPVISYACPCGPKDIIDEGKDGFLVPVNDEQTLADRIIRLIEDEELRRQMSKAALQKSGKYRMDKIIPMWMNLFEELLQEKRAKG